MVQVNEAPASAVKANDTTVPGPEAGGALVIVGAEGAVVSTVSAEVALPTLPAESVALTVNR